MAPDGYLSSILADVARPFRHRSGVRELLGVPEDGAKILLPAHPRGRFVYRRSGADLVRGSTAAEPGWEVQVVDDPADPWPDEWPPLAATDHHGRMRSVEPPPTAGGITNAAATAVFPPTGTPPERSACTTSGTGASPDPLSTVQAGDREERLTGPLSGAVVSVPGITPPPQRQPAPLAQVTYPAKAVEPEPARPPTLPAREPAAVPYPDRAAEPGLARAPTPPTPVRHPAGVAESPAPRQTDVRVTRYRTSGSGAPSMAIGPVAPGDGPAATEPAAAPAAVATSPEPVPPAAQSAKAPTVPSLDGSSPATAHRTRRPWTAAPAAQQRETRDRWTPLPSVPLVEDLPGGAVPRQAMPPESAPRDAAPVARSEDLTRRRYRQPAVALPSRPTAHTDVPAAPEPAPPPIVVVARPSQPAGPVAFWERRHVGRLRGRIPR